MTVPFRQASWATFEYLAYPLAMFAMAPFFVEKLGVPGYGLWMMLIALSGFGGVAGLGMGVVATRQIAHLRGRGDLSRASAVLRICLLASIGGWAVLGVFYCVLWIALPSHYLERIGSPVEIQMLLLASIVTVFFEQLDAVFAGAIRGAERFDLSSRAEIFSRLAAIALCAICTMLTSNAGLFFAVVTLGAALRMLTRAAIAIKLLGPLQWQVKFEWGEARAMLGFGSWVWVQNVGGFLFVSADRILIGSLLGSAAVAVYVTLTQLVQQIHAIPSAGSSVLFPLASRMRSEGRSVRFVVRIAFLMVIATAAILSTSVWLFGDLVIARWMGESFAVMGAGVLAVLALAYFLLATCVVPHYLLLAAGSVRVVALMNVAAGIAAMAFCWTLVPDFGLAGAAWSKVVFAAILAIGIMTFAWLTRGQEIAAVAPVAGETG